ncbi:xanthine dehydrogenase family protein molybdopterin-binding subunit [Bradyrhizobium prioriisuperbiae]|uniref:xanthine dehydrogenase family protein molybdopterin-binding subunit n=1 Tax=Bradyrhizobium prioriisuperbiae TaxID=2854389 RepID=UPI0028EFD8DD|nr:molybdopterin cofactor-binding domain-containing protein [Bradyrhizobium prioritasuperba]
MTDLPISLKANPRLDQWVSFDTDGVVTLRTGKVEIGQGAVTAIAAIAAKELGIDLDHIRMTPADTAVSPDEGYTSGSFSVEHSGSAMRWACALVRTLFEEQARAVLGDGELVVRSGVFMRAARNEGVSYWQLAAKVDLDRSCAELPPPNQYGGSIDHDRLRRLDLDAKLHGAAFIQDMTLPGMLYGRVLRPAHPHDRLQSFDRASVAALPGVVDVVTDGSFMGVVARRDDQALNAIRTADKSAEWTRERALPAITDPDAWMEGLTAQSTTFIADETAVPDDVQRHEARYSRPYLAHASIGPSCAVAQWEDGALTVWSHTQGVHPLRRTLARALRISPENVRVIHAQGSGCYGHNGADDVALDAALLARNRNAPVMCLWSRADELSWSPFGAPMRIALGGAIDDTGSIVEWTHEVWSPSHNSRPGSGGDGVNLLAAWSLEEPHPSALLNDVPRPYGGGDRNAVPLYRLGKRSVTRHLMPQGPLRSSAMRSLGAHGNVFAIESFMDELAAVAQVDPVEFRLRHLDDPRAIAVIKAAAERAGWDPAEPGGEGIGRGIAFSRYKNVGAYYAAVAFVEITETVRLRRVVGAVDAGEVIHRNGLLNQVEGGVVQAASWALKEKIGWTDDGFAVRSWADYPILNFSETPEIDTVIVEPPSQAALGAGECAAGPIAGAIGNAIAHALGVRVRDLPLTAERIEQAINASVN